jgi:hypothetical protein
MWFIFNLQRKNKHLEIAIVNKYIYSKQISKYNTMHIVFANKNTTQAV